MVRFLVSEVTLYAIIPPPTDACILHVVLASYLASQIRFAPRISLPTSRLLPPPTSPPAC